MLIKVTHKLHLLIPEPSSFSFIYASIFFKHFENPPVSNLWIISTFSYFYILSILFSLLTYKVNIWESMWHNSLCFNIPRESKIWGRVLKICLFIRGNLIWKPSEKLSLENVIFHLHVKFCLIITLSHCSWHLCFHQFDSENTGLFPLISEKNKAALLNFKSVVLLNWKV